MQKLCSLKDIVKTMKRQAIDGEKILQGYISDKGLTFRIHKELSKLNRYQATKFKNVQKI